jgi:perosamine synthetase
MLSRARPAIPLSEPELGGREWEYVKQCLDTGWVSSAGSFVGRFEREVAQRVQVPWAVATVNGTAALHLALRVAGVEPDDEVLVSDLTFIAPANAVRYLGAWPVFLDAEPDYAQLDPDAVAAFLERNCERSGPCPRDRRTGRWVRALLPVDILGHPVDLDPLLELCAAWGLALVEDATESLGARYKGVPVGSRAGLACLSFNGNKIITTGGGGMILASRQDWADRARHLSTQAKDDPVEFVHGAVGYNYRLSNVLAAIGTAQLERLDSFLERKRSLSERYDAALADVPGIVPLGQAPWAESSRWLYTVLVDEARFGMDSRDLLHRLEAAGIQARPLWQPMHLSPAHRDCAAAPCPNAARLHRRALCLPSSVGLTEADQERVVETIRAART